MTTVTWAVHESEAELSSVTANLPAAGGKPGRPGNNEKPVTKHRVRIMMSRLRDIKRRRLSLWKSRRHGPADRRRRT